MTWMVSAVRRSLWLVLIGAVGGVAWSWYRDRTAPPTPPAPPEWPPLDVQRSSDATSNAGTLNDPAPSDTTAPAPGANQSTGTVPNDDGSAASFVNALVDAPDARSAQSSGTWVAPDADGECPDSHPVKANDNSGIFHVPGGRFYARTKAERCYATAADALADGYRPAKA